MFATLNNTMAPMAANSGAGRNFPSPPASANSVSVSTVNLSLDLTRVELSADHIWGVSHTTKSGFAIPLESVLTLQFLTIPNRHIPRIEFNMLTLERRLFRLENCKLWMQIAGSRVWQPLSADQLDSKWLCLNPQEHKWLPFSQIRAIQVKGLVIACE